MKLTHFAQALTLALVAVTAYLAWVGQEESVKANAKMDLITQHQRAQQEAQPIQMPADAVPPPLTPAPLAVTDTTGSMLPPVSAASLPSTVSVPSAPVLPVSATPIAAGSKQVSPAAFGTAGSAPTTSPSSISTSIAKTPLPSSVAGSSAVTAAAAAPQPVPMTAMQRRIIDAPALGKVIAVVKEHGFVTLNVGKSKQVASGMKFDLRRTNGVVARIQITDVEEGESVADIDPKSVPAGIDVQAGDDVIQVVLPN